ncbi:hypothetical protein AVEN_105370-1 [Araneus ventricosus]|uniref:Uncharacterized protein n=1 Tax=Araneus ventricosus TaxID=182803 RepID=A0A4Y2KVA8_ARAVE|nr:hypothetical protein AVEN_105370-1 [Araneus ventricosus]
MPAVIVVFEEESEFPLSLIEELGRSRLLRSLYFNGISNQRSSARPSPRVHPPTENHETANDFQRGSSTPALYMRADGLERVGLEDGGGLITAGESSDMLYSKVSPSDAEEELISASTSDSRGCKILFSNRGRTSIGRSSVSTEVGLVVSKGFNTD